MVNEALDVTRASNGTPSHHGVGHGGHEGDREEVNASLGVAPLVGDAPFRRRTRRYSTRTTCVVQCDTIVLVN